MLPNRQKEGLTSLTLLWEIKRASKSACETICNPTIHFLTANLCEVFLIEVQKSVDSFEMFCIEPLHNLSLGMSELLREFL